MSAISQIVYTVCCLIVKKIEFISIYQSILMSIYQISE